MEDGNTQEHKQNIPEILQRLLDLIDETLDFAEYSTAVMHYAQAYQALAASVASVQYRMLDEKCNIPFSETLWREKRDEIVPMRDITELFKSPDKDQ